MQGYSATLKPFSLLGCRKPHTLEAPFSVQVFRSTSEVPVTWDTDLTPDTENNLSLSYLNILEQANLPGVQLRYILLYSGNRPVAAVYFQIHTLTPNKVPVPPFPGNAGRLLQGLIKTGGYKLLTSGSIYRNGPGWKLAEGFTTEQFARLFRALERMLTAEIKPDLILLKEADVLQPFTQKAGYGLTGYRPAPPDLQMELSIPEGWKTLADYAACLSRKYAARYRKTLEAAQSLNRRELTASETEALLPELNSLYQHIVSQNSLRLTEVNASCLLALKKQSGPAFVMEAWFDGEVPVAFSASFSGTDTFEIYLVGYSAEANTRYKLYHNLLLRGLEQAVLSCKKSLKLGRTAFEAKAILGATPVTYNHLIKIPSLMLRQEVKQVISRYTDRPDEAWKNRNPFKEQKEDAMNAAALNPEKNRPL